MAENQRGAAERLREEFEIVSRLGTQADINSAMLIAEKAIQSARQEALEEAAKAQPCTLEDPRSNYEKGFFEGVMAYGRAIRALATVQGRG